ncbi:MAG: TonB-dependent receptor domain-containing protein [Novosphingobium sp.]
MHKTILFPKTNPARIERCQLQFVCSPPASIQMLARGVARRSSAKAVIARPSVSGTENGRVKMFYQNSRTSLRRNYSNGVALAGLALSLALPAAAHAQDAADDEASKDEIVVTGTLIRGKEPVGSQQITLGAEKLESVAPQSSNDLLASLPQVTNYFNRVPLGDLSIAVNQIQIARPNLRNISGNSAASSGTLILVDGHRVATAGVNQASVDPDLVPIGAIERVEVVTEGGSATYGADAVAGTINFITRRRFDGLKVDAHYGIADPYWQWDASVTAGKAWDTGSIWVSYSYAENKALFGRDRSFIRFLDYSKVPYVGNDTNCPTPSTSITTKDTPTGGSLYSVSTPITTSRCDNSQNASKIPAAQRHGVMAGLSQDLDSQTAIDIRAYYSQRKTHSSSDFTASVPLNSNNPYASSLTLPAGTVVGAGVQFFNPPLLGFIPALPTNTSAQVGFNLSPLLGPGAASADVTIKEWGVASELKHDFGDNWQVRGLLNWSESESGYSLIRLNTLRLNAASAPSAPATTATAFNPINVVNNNPALIKDLIDNEIAGQTKDSIINMRLIAEGKLLDLPGGEARLAVGGEYFKDRLALRTASDIRRGTLSSRPYSIYNRDVTSVFGELQLPLIANSDGGSLVTVSASGRYDHYSDFGNTTNPKIGVTIKPVSWFTLRGNWGKSFTAPTPLDQLQSNNSTISSFPFVPFTDATHPNVTGGQAIALQGSKAGLQPQKATTWSVGFDMQPLDGLRFSANYYDVNFTNILSTPTPNAGIFTNFPDNIQYGSALTTAQINAFFAARGPFTASQQAQLASAIAATSGGPVVELVDFRTGNYGVLHVRGMDFDASYRHATDFGGFDVSLAGNHQFSRKAQISPTSAVADDNSGEYPKWYLQATAGVDVGTFRAQASWNYTGGYKLAAPLVAAPANQTSVGSFSTFNLFFKYEVPADSGLLKDLSFTLNVNNVLDTAPPIFLGNTTAASGYTNGFTLGRLFNFGVSKKF